MKTLSEFLTQKYLEWQAKLGDRKTIEEFAAYLKVSRSLLSYWMNGKRIPSKDALEILSQKLGNEIYDVVNIPRPNPYLQKINRLWANLPKDIQQRLAEEVEQFELINKHEQYRKASKHRATVKDK